MSQLLDIAIKEHEAWLRAYEKHERRGDGTAAEACLMGANAIEQLLKKLRKAARELPNGKTKP